MRVAWRSPIKGFLISGLGRGIAWWRCSSTCIAKAEKTTAMNGGDLFAAL
jgi:hypothetical protein